MINAAKELGRTVGYKPALTNGVIAAADHIVSGRFIKLDEVSNETVVRPILGTETAANVDLLGIAADDTQRLPYNGLYEVIDNFCKYGKVAAFVCGGLFTVWDDSRGAVFAADTYTAKAGTPLYIAADGTLTATKGADDTVGAIVVGSIIRAPQAATGTLFFKAKGL